MLIVNVGHSFLQQIAESFNGTLALCRLSGSHTAGVAAMGQQGPVEIAVAHSCCSINSQANRDKPLRYA